MATITADVKPRAGGTRLATWETMGDADTGTSVQLSDYPDKTIQVTGTFGGATVTVQGSNDGTNWETLNDQSGAALTFTAAGMAYILENPEFVRVTTAGGTSSDIDVTIMSAK